MTEVWEHSHTPTPLLPTLSHTTLKGCGSGNLSLKGFPHPTPPAGAGS